MTYKTNPLICRFLENFENFCKSHYKNKVWELQYQLMKSIGNNDSKMSYGFVKKYFEKYVDYLVKNEYISPILEFMCGIFCDRDDYDVDFLAEVLKSKTINDVTLYDLFIECYKEIKKKECMYEYFEIDAQTIDGMDIFKDDLSKIEYNCINMPVVIHAVCDVIYRNVYKIEIDFENLDMETIDKLFNKVTQTRREKLENENLALEEENKKIDEKQKKYESMGLNYNISKKYISSITEEKYEEMVPGVLFPIIRWLELHNKKELCYSALDKYIFPVFKRVKWYKASLGEDVIRREIFVSFSSWIWHLIVCDYQILTSKRYTPNYYDEKDFYQELLGNKGLILECGEKLNSVIPNAAICLAEMFLLGRENLQQYIPDYIYSFYMAIIPFLLLSAGKNMEASEFLIENYNHISQSDRQNFFVQITLVNCIMKSNELEDISILSEYYNYEMNRQKFTKNRMKMLIEKMLGFIEQAKDMLIQKNEHTFETKESFYELLFKDGKINQVVENVKLSLKEKEMPPVENMNALMKIVNAFSYETGIHLGLLGYGRVDGYDKLEGALSVALVREGQGLVSNYNIDMKVANNVSVSQYDVKNNISYYIQEKIIKLRENRLLTQLEEIAQMKKLLVSDCCDEGVLMQELSKQETLLKRGLLNEYSARTEIEADIISMQNDFIRRFNLDIDSRALIGKLPLDKQQELNNNMITSEIVFRTLRSRNDDNLDFSPAIISLTKTIEMIFNHIYSKMSVQDFSGIDVNVQKNLLRKKGDKFERKPSIEFGPGIYLLMDSQGLSITNVGGNNYEITPKGVYAKSHYNEWNGDAVLDLEKLNKLDGLELLVDDSNKNPVKIKMGTDTQENKMKLVAALLYIKNHYRNIVAHKDPLAIEKVDECKQLLLQTEYLLWICLYILK